MHCFPQIFVVTNDRYGMGAEFIRSVMLTLSMIPKDRVLAEFEARYPPGRPDPECWKYPEMAAEGIYLTVGGWVGGCVLFVHAARMVEAI